MAAEKITKLRRDPKDAPVPLPGEGLRPVGLTMKAIRHRLLAEKQGRFAKVVQFKRRPK